MEFCMGSLEQKGIASNPNPAKAIRDLLTPACTPTSSDQISLKWAGTPAATDKSYLVNSGMPAAYDQN
jgi:hypothetical protein